MSIGSTLKETSLAPIHKALGARMVGFVGWNMPVQYKSIMAEHMAVRTKVGVFDVSHMGEFLVSGDGAFDFLQHVIANDLSKLKQPNTALYTQLTNSSGGTVDDLIVYRRDSDFLLVVNASNIEKDWNWLKQHVKQFHFHRVDLLNISEQTALLALQGPHAKDLLAAMCGEFVLSMPSFSYGRATVCGAEISFGRTGYTGEDGFEVFMSVKDAETIWTAMLVKGQTWGIEPCGLGARDTLRLEAGLPLYGHELDEHISPLEAAMGWSVKLDKGDFIGRDVLLAQKKNGLKKISACLKVEGKALPRQGYAVFHEQQQVGSVSSGSQGVFVGYPIAMAFVPPELSKVGTKLSVQIRDSLVPCEVVVRPFYKRK